MNIFIVTLTGEKLTISVSPDVSILDVKKVIVPLQQEIKSADDMLLIYGSKRLENDHTLLDYNIQQDWTLSMARLYR